MKKFLKFAVAAVVVLVVLVGVGVFVLMSRLDGIARTQIEKHATYALGVPVTLASVNIGLAAGSFKMGDLHVSNPEGYDNEHFLELGSGGLSLEYGSLRTDVIEVPTLTLENLDLDIVKKGDASNYGVILENLKRFETKGPSDPAAKDEKKFVIKRLEIKDVKANVQYSPIAGAEVKADTTIPSIILTDIGSGGKPVTLGELANIIVKAIMESVSSLDANILPGELLSDLQSRLGDLKSLEDLGVSLSADLGKGLEGLAGEAGKALEDVEEGLDKAKDEIEGGLKDVKDRIKGITGGGGG